MIACCSLSDTSGNSFQVDERANDGYLVGSDRPDQYRPAAASRSAD